MMSEGFSPQAEKGPLWILPDFGTAEEVGELARVARIFNPEDPEEFTKFFYKRLHEHLSIQSLTDEMLAELDNTDAADIAVGDFDAVQRFTAEGNAVAQSPRNWAGLKTKMENGKDLDMPVIVKIKSHMHLMSGNTRLMVARALGITPKVAIVDLGE